MNRNSTLHPLAGFKALDYPLEKHNFRSGKDEFLCDVCGRPRALHDSPGVEVYKDTPFKPNFKEKRV